MKIWKADSRRPALDLKEHMREGKTLKCAPNYGKNLMFATASSDRSVKLWDIKSERSMRTLVGNSEPLCLMDFSPNAEFLTTGSDDHSINIWSVKNGMLLKKFKGAGIISHVKWNLEGNKVAACSNDNMITVIDMKSFVVSHITN